MQTLIKKEWGLGSSEVKALEKRFQDLERVFGKKTLEDEIFREVGKVVRIKTDLAVAVIALRGFAVKTVADTVGFSPSQFHSRLREVSRRAGDTKFLASIRTLTDNYRAHE